MLRRHVLTVVLESFGIVRALSITRIRRLIPTRLMVATGSSLAGISAAGIAGVRVTGDSRDGRTTCPTLPSALKCERTTCHQQ